MAVEIIGERVGTEKRLSGVDGEFHLYVVDRNAVGIDDSHGQGLCQALCDLPALLIADEYLHRVG
ncbi:MAG: hypothetical protein BWY83_03027 [bacterium ADurb.Bin478]|nr:MAG: hypothetical protein BWY83_03027 [bacterium ADurb.Bin478]